MFSSCAAGAGAGGSPPANPRLAKLLEAHGPLVVARLAQLASLERE